VRLDTYSHVAPSLQREAADRLADADGEERNSNELRVTLNHAIPVL
jgi:hypothetical protein